MKKLNFWICLLLFTFGLSLVYAVSVDPSKKIQNITKMLQGELKQHRSHMSKDPTFIYKIVEQIVLPSVDFVEMAKWIAGKQAWYAASTKEQNDFIKEFKQLLLRTYATALNKYTDEQIEFLPARFPANATRVQIASKIVRPGKDEIKVDYRLVAINNDWKLYDIVIEGVSILQGFQAQFSEQIRNHGVRSVIDKIKYHNAGKNE